MLPSAVDLNTKHVERDIQRFIHKHALIPPLWEKIIAHYIKMTWVYDCFNALPYLRFMGEPETGKSRLLQICIALSYKAMPTAGNVTGPVLFRTIDEGQGTLIVDECDLDFSDATSDIVKVFTQGYMKGFPVRRCAPETHVVECHKVYGPKIITCRMPFKDRAMDTRCLTYCTVARDLPTEMLNLSPEFSKEAEALRNRLLGWRLQNYSNVRADASGLRNLISPRLAQISSAILGVTEDAEFRERFIAFLENYGRESRADSPQAFVVQALMRLFPIQPNPQSIPVASVTGQVNIVCAENGCPEMTAERVGSLLGSLGLKKHRIHGGTRCIALTERILDCLRKKYPQGDSTVTAGDSGDSELAVEGDG